MEIRNIAKTRSAVDVWYPEIAAIDQGTADRIVHLLHLVPPASTQIQPVPSPRDQEERRGEIGVTHVVLLGFLLSIGSALLLETTGPLYVLPFLFVMLISMAGVTPIKFDPSNRLFSFPLNVPEGQIGEFKKNWAVLAEKGFLPPLDPLLSSLDLPQRSLDWLQDQDIFTLSDMRERLSRGAFSLVPGIDYSHVGRVRVELAARGWTFYAPDWSNPERNAKEYVADQLYSELSHGAMIQELEVLKISTMRELFANLVDNRSFKHDPAVEACKRMRDMGYRSIGGVVFGPNQPIPPDTAIEAIIRGKQKMFDRRTQDKLFGWNEKLLARLQTADIHFLQELLNRKADLPHIVGLHNAELLLRVVRETPAPRSRSRDRSAFIGVAVLLTLAGLFAGLSSLAPVLAEAQPFGMGAFIVMGMALSCSFLLYLSVGGMQGRRRGRPYNPSNPKADALMFAESVLGERHAREDYSRRYLPGALRAAGIVQMKDLALKINESGLEPEDVFLLKAELDRLGYRVIGGNVYGPRQRIPGNIPIERVLAEMRLFKIEAVPLLLVFARKGISTVKDIRKKIGSWYRNPLVEATHAQISDKLLHLLRLNPPGPAPTQIHPLRSPRPPRRGGEIGVTQLVMLGALLLAGSALLTKSVAPLYVLPFLFVLWTSMAGVTGIRFAAELGYPPWGPSSSWLLINKAKKFIGELEFIHKNPKMKIRTRFRRDDEGKWLISQEPVTLDPLWKLYFLDIFFNVGRFSNSFREPLRRLMKELEKTCSNILAPGNLSDVLSAINKELSDSREDNDAPNNLEVLFKTGDFLYPNARTMSRFFQFGWHGPWDEGPEFVLEGSEDVYAPITINIAWFDFKLTINKSERSVDLSWGDRIYGKVRLKGDPDVFDMALSSDQKELVLALDKPLLEELELNGNTRDSKQSPWQQGIRFPLTENRSNLTLTLLSKKEFDRRGYPSLGFEQLWAAGYRNIGGKLYPPNETIPGDTSIEAILLSKQHWLDGNDKQELSKVNAEIVKNLRVHEITNADMLRQRKGILPAILETLGEVDEVKAVLSIIRETPSTADTPKKKRKRSAFIGVAVLLTLAGLVAGMFSLAPVLAEAQPFGMGAFIVMGMTMGLSLILYLSVGGRSRGFGHGRPYDPSNPKADALMFAEAVLGERHAREDYSRRYLPGALRAAGIVQMKDLALKINESGLESEDVFLLKAELDRMGYRVIGGKVYGPRQKIPGNIVIERVLSSIESPAPSEWMRIFFVFLSLRIKTVREIRNKIDSWYPQMGQESADKILHLLRLNPPGPAPTQIHPLRSPRPPRRLGEIGVTQLILLGFLLLIGSALLLETTAPLYVLPFLFVLWTSMAGVTGVKFGNGEFVFPLKVPEEKLGEFREKIWGPLAEQGYMLPVDIPLSELGLPDESIDWLQKKKIVQLKDLMKKISIGGFYAVPGIGMSHVRKVTTEMAARGWAFRPLGKEPIGNLLELLNYREIERITTAFEEAGIKTIAKLGEMSLADLRKTLPDNYFGVAVEARNMLRENGGGTQPDFKNPDSDALEFLLSLFQFHTVMKRFPRSLNLSTVRELFKGLDKLPLPIREKNTIQGELAKLGYRLIEEKAYGPHDSVDDAIDIGPILLTAGFPVERVLEIYRALHAKAIQNAGELRTNSAQLESLIGPEDTKKLLSIAGASTPKPAKKKPRRGVLELGVWAVLAAFSSVPLLAAMGVSAGTYIVMGMALVLAGILIRGALQSPHKKLRDRILAAARPQPFFGNMSRTVVGENVTTVHPLLRTGLDLQVAQLYPRESGFDTLFAYMHGIAHGAKTDLAFFHAGQKGEDFIGEELGEIKNLAEAMRTRLDYAEGEKEGLLVVPYPPDLGKAAQARLADVAAAYPDLIQLAPVTAEAVRMGTYEFLLKDLLTTLDLETDAQSVANRALLRKVLAREHDQINLISFQKAPEFVFVGELAKLLTLLIYTDQGWKDVGLLMVIEAAHAAAVKA